jgi:polysaccharide biosynthesis/export protein
VRPGSGRLHRATQDERGAWLNRLAACAAAALLAFALQGTADASEALGAGDAVRITVFQNPDLATEARLSERGSVVFPLIGEVTLSGQTPAQASARIAALLKSGNFLKNPQVSVAVMQVRSRQVSVLGHVARPGRYPLDDPGTRLTDLLALAGGISPGGADTVTLVSEEKTLEIDVARMVRSGDLSQNVEVHGGDTLYVGRAPVFYIYGEVQRAGAYRLEPNMAVMQALSTGGGLTARGTTRGLRIHRRTPGGEVRELEVQLSDPVQADDVITVRQSLF